MFSIFPNIDQAIIMFFFIGVICAFLFITMAVFAFISVFKWPKFGQFFIVFAILFGCFGAGCSLVMKTCSARTNISSVSVPCDQISALKNIKMDAKKFLGIPCDSLIVLKIQQYNFFGQELVTKYDVETIAGLILKKY